MKTRRSINIKDILSPMNLFYSFTRAVFRAAFSIFYNCKFYGNRDLLKGGAILAANHTSFLDPPLISALCRGEIHFLARDTLFSPTWFGFLLKALNAHPIQRDLMNVSSFKSVSQLLKEDKKVLIFPEGLRSKDGSLQPLKRGVSMLALHVERPIIPVYIEGAFQAWPTEKKWPKWGYSITCAIGKPIFPNPTSASKRDAQLELNREVEHAFIALREWLRSGAQGEIP